MIKFEKCCGCVDLKTGCLIIGYIGLIAEVILFIMGLIGEEEVIADQLEQEEKTPVLLSVTFMILMLMLLGFTIALLIGLHKNKPELVKIYLVASVVSFVLFIIGFLCSIITRGLRFRDVLDLVQLGASVYFLLVIRSQYLKMKDETQHGIADSNDI